MGNLVDFQADRKGLTLTIQNGCLPLPAIGCVQALVEMAYQEETSSREWEFSQDGDLTISIRVK